MHKTCAIILRYTKTEDHMYSYLSYHTYCLDTFILLPCCHHCGTTVYLLLFVNHILLSKLFIWGPDAKPDIIFNLRVSNLQGTSNVILSPWVPNMKVICPSLSVVPVCSSDKIPFTSFLALTSFPIAAWPLGNVTSSCKDQKQVRFIEYLVTMLNIKIKTKLKTSIPSVVFI